MVPTETFSLSSRTREREQRTSEREREQLKKTSKDDCVIPE